MQVERLSCQNCGGQWDFAERVGTTSPYVKNCPGCGIGQRLFDIYGVDTAYAD